MDDERFYEEVAAELKKGERREGLWAKALAEAVNDESVAQSLYVKWRVSQLIGQEEARIQRRWEEVRAQDAERGRIEKEQARQWRRTRAWGVCMLIVVIAVSIGLLLAL